MRILVLAALLIPASMLQAAPLPVVILNGDNAVPANPSSAAGFAFINIDQVQQTMDILMFVGGIALGDLLGVGPNNTAVHLHRGGPGSTGPIIADLGFTGTIFAISGGFGLFGADLQLGGVQGGLDTGLTAAQVIAAILADDTYLNIHTTASPGGEIRGNVATPEPAAISLLGLGVLGVGLITRRRRLQA